LNLFFILKWKFFGMKVLLKTNRIIFSQAVLSLVFLLSDLFSPTLAQESLWGMTRDGGADNFGCIFKVDANGENHELKFSFPSDGSLGQDPYASLVEFGGKLYGMTRIGGTNNNGVLFEFDPTDNTYSKKLDFDASSTGSFPYSSMISYGGKLYGMVYSGGVYGWGILFEYDPLTNTYTKKFDFDGVNKGQTPYGNLLESGGKLYGMTRGGGVNNMGVLFEYDPSSNSYSKKLDFDGLNNHVVRSLDLKKGEDIYAL